MPGGHSVAIMAARLDIALQRNEDWAKTLTLTDTAGRPIDLTGCSVAMQVRDKLSQDLISEAVIAVEDAVSGIITVTLQGSEGSPLGQYGASIQTANLHHDLRLIDSLGTPTVLFAGIVILSRGETRR